MSEIADFPSNNEDEYVEQPEPQVDIEQEAPETPSEGLQEDLDPAQRFAQTQEQRARDSGWVDLREWVDAGKDPSDWVPADHFNLRGEFIGKLKAKDEKLERELADQRAFMQAQAQAKIQELMKQRNDAVLMGGEEAITAVNDIDKQIFQQQRHLQPAQSQEPPELAKWNAENPWIFENTPKAEGAKAAFRAAVASGASVTEAIAQVDGLYNNSPASNPHKPSVPQVEAGKNRGFKAKPSKNLTMADVTREELKMRDAFPTWTDEQFLKAVKNSRA